ncbi:MAG: cation:proton antiporter [Proteobacteria bacterium]|nr:cation:proton antiporter [Pseudomonadota bacterium]
MSHTAEFLIAIGGILLVGLVTDYIGRHTFLPRVTLLLIFGVTVGDEALALIPASLSDQFEPITNMALLMVGFLLGGKLTRRHLAGSRKQLLWVSITAALGCTVVVALGLTLLGAPLAVAVLLGCIAAATDPAATSDVVLESKASDKNPFARLLLNIVALDDVWALIIFSLGLAVVAAMLGGNGAGSPLMFAMQDIGGALLLGLAIGLPAANLTGRISPGQPMLAEALGLVFLCGGIALYLHVSFLIATMTMGAVIANFAWHHEYPFHEIENIEWPFMVIFFVLAGASLEFSALNGLGLIGAVFIVGRIIGKIGGAWMGASVSNTDATTKHFMGMALLPQAGVATGMALVASNQFPEYRPILLSIAISTTVFFEIAGPIFTRFALQRALK